LCVFQFTAIEGKGISVIARAAQPKWESFRRQSLFPFHSNTTTKKQLSTVKGKEPWRVIGNNFLILQQYKTGNKKPNAGTSHQGNMGH
jgi:hypothetical protein